MSIYVGESRGELIAWLDQLIAPGTITKVEQCGTGAVYCQIMDSIYGDLPMSKVKFNARQEYEYLDNFKILQKCFHQKKIEKPIPVDKLVKCKMQDNLEFLQWMKKYWDSFSTGAGYDAAARSGGQAVAPATSGPSSRAAPSARTTTRTPLGAGPGAGAGRSTSAASSAQLQTLNAMVAEQQATIETIEKERDFYFDKLRNVELIVQDRMNIEGIAAEEKDVLARVQEILYSTADGFEMPENGHDDAELEAEGEEETY